MTVPFIDGKNLGVFAEDEIVTQVQMAKLMLRLAEELQRIHDVGIIHADIGLRNVMVRHSKSNRDYVIHFIDFGMAYKKNGYATVNFQSHKPTTKSGKKASSTEMAPERFPNRKLKAHPRQDVFSLAKTLNKMIKHRRATWRKNFANQYPFIKSFITTGSDKNPVNRPSLPEFIVKLRNHIDCQETLPADLFNLVLALEADDMSAARKLLEAKSSHYTREKLTPVLYRLIKNQAYDLAEKLMSLRKGIPLDRDVNGDHIFTLAAADNEMDNYQFGLMLDYIPKNQLIAVITKENHDGITALRGMVQNQRLSYLIEKLEEQPKLLSEMAAIKISGSTTPESAALHILAQLCKFKNLATDGRRNQLFRGNTAQHKKNIEHAAYYLIEQILSPSNKDDDEFSIHEDIIRETPYLAKLHRDLLINNLIASPQAEESLFGFLPKLFG